MSPSTKSSFESLTWDNLNLAFGPTVVQRGKQYQKRHAVSELAQTDDGGLVAWVLGTHRYATRVEMTAGQPRGACSCPYASNCKHAVAVVLEYLDCRKHGKALAKADATDPRVSSGWPTSSLSNQRDDDGDWDDEDQEDWNDEPDEDWDEDDIDADDREGQPPGRVSRPIGRAVTQRRNSEPSVAKLQTFIRQQTSETMAAWLIELADVIPEVRQNLSDRQLAASGAIDELILEARQAIEELSNESDWADSWSETSAISSFSRVRGLLALLLERGAADVVIDLSERLLDSPSHADHLWDSDTGADALAECIDVVYMALPQSGKTPAQQILWAIDLQRHDQFDLCQGKAAEHFWNQPFSSATWSEVADVLYEKLKKPLSKAAQNDFMLRSRREAITSYLLDALQRAGRENEIIPLCEQEAEKTASYERLVERLFAAGRDEEAVQWIRRGVEATQKQYPGVAAILREQLREYRQHQGDWKMVAADLAQEFFHQPSLLRLQQLLEVAEKAKCREAVELAARRYLETGAPPQSRPRGAKSQRIPPWPLPAPETLTELASRYGHRDQPPFYGVLIDLAFAEDDPKAALRWYDEALNNNRPMRLYDEKVADGIVDIEPDRSIAFWAKAAEREIARVSPRAYQAAAHYLRKIRRALQGRGRSEEWHEYLGQLRQTHRRKHRLIEVLDTLEEGPILQA
jgi:uncharacterized Zn finger protein